MPRYLCNFFEFYLKQKKKKKKNNLKKFTEQVPFKIKAWIFSTVTAKDQANKVWFCANQLIYFFIFYAKLWKNTQKNWPWMLRALSIHDKSIVKSWH